MTAEKGYQGWTNYETWSVNLLLTNDQGSYSYWQEQAQRCLDDAEGRDPKDRKDSAAAALADQLKDEVEEGNPLKDDITLYAQLLSGAISEANWYEIAESWLDEMEPTADDE